MLAERSPHRVEVAMRQRFPVHRGRGDHGQPDPLGAHPGDLLDGPGRIVQEDMSHPEEPALPVAARFGGEAVVGARIGPLGDPVRGKPLLPQQSVVGEENCSVETEGVERVQAGAGQPVGIGHEVVEGRRCVLAAHTAQPIVADQGRALRDRHLERSEWRTAPREPGPTLRVIGNRQRVVAVCRIDVVGPGRPRLEKVLVDVNGRKCHEPSPAQSISGPSP